MQHEIFNNYVRANASEKIEEEYSSVLDSFGVKYSGDGLYFQVGSLNGHQGWILHLSVIPIQMRDLILLIIPELLKKHVTFKIAREKDAAMNLLYGNLGYQNMGKVICVYPENDADAVSLSKKLLRLTEGFRGSYIPTDIPLGGILYTRYARFEPIIQPDLRGKEFEYFYDASGNLVKDDYAVPFQLPQGVKWPFDELASSYMPASKKILHDIYRPLSILKSDPRGNVIEGLYLKNLFRVGKCVIKIGKKNMIADDLGRDMHDRLLWQKRLHQSLEGLVPVPKILDFFKEKDDTYLVMEYIKGRNLYDRIIEIYGSYKSFFQLSELEQLELIDYLLEILSIVKKMHDRGFVHRDIAPGNFIIDKNNQVVLIDLELSYSLNEEKSLPPFELGTPGFMSAEQASISLPTIKEDIYGIGALMIFVFTGLPPIRFDRKNPVVLKDHLGFFICHEGITEMITRCLDKRSDARPALNDIRNYLKKFRKQMGSESFSIQPGQSVEKITTLGITKIINGSIESLEGSPTPVSKGRWMSKSVNQAPTGAVQKEFTAQLGLHTGMSGVLYMLGKAQKIGFNIDKVKYNYYTSWAYIEKICNEDSGSNLGPGLYNGKAGIALAMLTGIDCGLLENNDIRKSQIRKLLDNSNDHFGIAEGFAGQGMVILLSESVLGHEVSSMLIERILLSLLNNQQYDGSWLNPISQEPLPVGFTSGISGILWFLLECYAKYTDDIIGKAIMKAVGYLLIKTNYGNNLFNSVAFRRMLKKGPELGDERTGFILCCIKAFEILGDTLFKETAEKVLNQYPAYVVNHNFSQESGLAALGEVYWEAWKIFHNKEWKDRAEWIANIFCHTSLSAEDGRCCWLLEETYTPAADLMNGNAGIIYYLLRTQNPEKIGLIMMS